MATARQLFNLQELDLEIARVTGQVASVEIRIGDRSPLAETEAALQEAQERQRKLQADHAENELQAGTIRSKLQQDRDKMYGGTVTNLRELEGLAEEAALLEADLQKREEALLQMMESLEESTATLAEAENGARLKRPSGTRNRKNSPTSGSNSAKTWRTWNPSARRQRPPCPLPT